MNSCPACKNPMVAVQIPSVQLDQCRDCLGVWFDQMEIDELFALHKVPERFLNQERYRPTPQMVPEGQRQCPRCQVNLLTVSVDGISLDACRQCKGFFADLGEISRLLEASERRAAAD